MTAILSRVKVPPPEIPPVIPVDRASAKPLYRQLYDNYRDAILVSRLRPGQRLPSTRSLAAELGVSRIPVLNAFEQLLAEGFFESRVGSGTFVARSLPEGLASPPRPSSARKPPPRRTPRVTSERCRALLGMEPGPWYRGTGAFSVGQPPIDCFPSRLWSSLVARQSRKPDQNLLHYSHPLGLGSLREAVAGYLTNARGVRCTADQIMIVNGSQQALDLTIRVLLDPGSPVWIEDPSYFGARRALRLAGARLVPVPVDEEGLDVDRAVALCPKARAAFVTPSHQFPLGVTMSATRRLQLLDWSRTTGSWVIEDDYDSEYRYGNLPIAAIQGLDRDSRVVYIGTFTKIVFPALRLGYVVIPRDLIRPFTEVRRATDMFSPTFHQAVLTTFIREGHFARHIRRMRLLCRERRRALVEELSSELGDTLRVLGDQAGMYLTAALLGRWRDRDISEGAALAGLMAAPLSESYVGNRARQGLILGYGGTSVAEIAPAVRALRDVIHSLQTANRRSNAR